MKLKRIDWQLDIRYMLKFSDVNRFLNVKERSYVIEVKSWGDFVFVSDMYRKSKGIQDLFLKLLFCKGNFEVLVCILGIVSDVFFGGLIIRVFVDEEL